MKTAIIVIMSFFVYTVMFGFTVEKIQATCEESSLICNLDSHYSGAMWPFYWTMQLGKLIGE